MVAKEVAAMYGLSRKQVYEEILNMETENGRARKCMSPGNHLQGQRHHEN
jgi:hypothetical protein